MMTNGDPEGRIFLSYPHTNNGFLICSCLSLFFFLFKNKLPEVPEYAKIQFHMMINNQYPVVKECLESKLDGQIDGFAHSDYIVHTFRQGKFRHQIFKKCFIDNFVLHIFQFKLILRFSADFKCF